MNKTASFAGKMKKVNSFKGRFKSEEGFSLIEQLFTLIIISIISTSMLPVLLSGMARVKAEDYQVRASSITQEMMEAARAAPFTDLNIGTYTTGGAGPTPDTSALAQSFNLFEQKVTDSTFLPQGSGSIAIVSPGEISTSSEIRAVQVNVNWMQGEITKSFDVSTYIYNYPRD